MRGKTAAILVRLAPTPKANSPFNIDMLKELLAYAYTYRN